MKRTEQAIVIGRDALAISPFDPELHFRVGLAAGQIGDFVTATYQFAYTLLLKPNATEIADKFHVAMRLAATAPNASRQLGGIAFAPPDSPPLFNELAWTLSTNPDANLRDGTRAVLFASRACSLTHRQQSALLATLSAAYAEDGKFADAADTAREALALARSKGDAKTAALAEKLLASFQSQQPYREEPAR